MNVLKIGKTIFFGGFLLLGFACQNFEYSHPICTPDLRVDVDKLPGTYHQFNSGFTLFSNPAIEGGTEIAAENFTVERTGLGQYKLVNDAGTAKDLTVCKIGNRTFVENLNMSAGGGSSKRAIFQLESLPDGYLLSALQVNLKELKSSTVPYDVVQDIETLKLDTNGVLKVEERNAEQKAKDAKEHRNPSKGFLINTSNPKDGESLAKILVVDSDAKRIFRGTYKK